MFLSKARCLLSFLPVIHLHNYPTLSLLQFPYTLTCPLPLLTEFSKRLPLDNKVKYLKEYLSRVVAGGDPLKINLDREFLERLTSKRYMSELHRHRINEMSSQAELPKEVINSGYDCYIPQDKSYVLLCFDI